MKKSIVILEFLVGLLAIIAAIITMNPFILGIPIGAQIMVFGLIILGLTTI